MISNLTMQRVWGAMRRKGGGLRAALAQWKLEREAAAKDATYRAIAPACPTCGSRSENWKPQHGICYDCGTGARVGADPDTLLHMLASGEIAEERFIVLGLASGLSVHRLSDMLLELEQRRESGTAPDAPTTGGNDGGYRDY